MKRDSSTGDVFGRGDFEVKPLADRLTRRDQPAGGGWLDQRREPAVRNAFAPPAADAAAHRTPADDPALRKQLDEARAEAERAGLSKAQSTVQSVMDRYFDAIRELGERASRDRPQASEVVSLAMVVAREILGRELRVDNEPIVTALDEALRQVGTQPMIVVRLGRADLEYVRRRRPDLVQAGIELMLDESLGAGGCIVEAPDQIVDASIEARLSAARDAVAVAIDRDRDEPVAAGDVSPSKVAAC